MQECYLTKAGFCEPKHPLTQSSDVVPWVGGVIVGSDISLEFYLLKTHPNLLSFICSSAFRASAAGRVLGCRYPRCHLSVRIMSPHLRRHAGTAARC